MTDIAQTANTIISQLNSIPGGSTIQALKNFIVSVMKYSPVNVWWYANGATLDDGVTDASVAFNLAANTGQTVYMPKPAVSYRLSNSVNISTPGQIWKGDGQEVSVIKVDTSFSNMSASGIFISNIPGPPGPQFRDFSITFTQPDTLTRGSLTIYPAAFYSQNQAFSKWRNIGIYAGTNGVDLQGSFSGGSSIEECKFECFGSNVLINGAADDVFITRNRFEADKLTANQQSIYFSSGTVGLSCGRCDGLHLHENLFIVGLGVQFYPGATQAAFGTITNNVFDSYSAINCNGAVQMCGSGNLFTLISNNISSITMTNGKFALSSCQMYASLALNVPQISIIPASGTTCKMELTGWRISSAIPGADTTSISITNTVGTLATLTVTGSNIEIPTNTNKVNASIIVAGTATLIMNGNSVDPAGSATGNVVSVFVDGKHNIVGNAFNGWGLGLPSGHTLLTANNNN